jgi:hypothetical protein
MLAGCPSAEEPPPAVVEVEEEEAPQDAFMAQLQALCGNAYRGEMAVGSAQDTLFADREMVIHVRECREDEVRIPLHVEGDRSRTWIVTRLDDGLRLKHDHRHEDGTEDEITQYGGDTVDEGTAAMQEFHADDFTAELVPAAATNIWTIEVVPGERFSYSLRREAEDRYVRFDFDLSELVIPSPPAPWGHE